MAFLLEMKGVDKQFPGTHALDHVNFNLRKGEIHSLIGQNGSGKSTLMNILSGGLRMDQGEVLKNGIPIQIKSPQSAMNHGIAMIHQELKLFADLTVAENIYFGCCPKKGLLIDWKKLNEMADEAMRPFSDKIKGTDRIRDLSVAEQQLVEIARAVSKKTEIVIMDEPTASLTDEETQTLFRQVERIKGMGVSIVFISHRLDEVMQISDRVTVLRDGVLIGSLERNEIRDKDQLVNMMIAVKPQMLNRKIREQTGSVVLETKGLCYSNRVKDVSLSLHQGEVVGIAGLVGAGRTELLKTIFGAYSSDGGEIRVGGKEYTRLNPQRAVKLGIAYMSEDRKNEGLLLKMSIEDNEIYAGFDLYSRMGVIDTGRQKKAVEEMGRSLRIKAAGSKVAAGSLSGGNQQKIVIAKWLIAEASIILMDEPTRGIDVGAKGEIYGLVRQLADEGKSILFVSSELEEIQIVSDRILVMKEGRITKELPGNSTVEEMMHYAV